MSKTRGKNKNKNTIRRRRNKNSIQKSRGKHRRKTMKYLGGAPKISFPYVYYPVLKAVLDNNPVLNQYIQWRTCLCVERTKGTAKADITAKCGDPSISTVNIDPINILSDDNMVLVLVMKYDSAMRITRDPSRLNNADVLVAEILGHCIVKLLNNKACIYNVCSHSREGEGYGKILFNSVMQFIKDRALTAKITQCWLYIDMSNVLFDKVANIYVSAGFGGGNITNFDPLDNKPLDHEVMALLLQQTDIVNELSTRIELAKVLQLKTQFNNCVTSNTNYSTVNFKFDKNCIMHLRLLPFSATKMIDGNIIRTFEAVNDTPGASNIRELAGKFIIYNVDMSENVAYSVYTLSLTTLAEDASIEYTIGPDENKLSVMVPISSYTFHTHPIQGYYEFNVIIMTPSNADFNAFFTHLFITPSVNSNFIIPQFHVVVTVEGIYIISLDKQAIEKIDDVLLHKKSIIDMMIPTLEYPIPNRYFNWNNFDSLPEDAVTTALDTYKKWFEKQNIITFNGIPLPLFKLDIIRWNELTVDRIMEINCPLIQANPFVDTEDYFSNTPTVTVDDNFYTSKHNLALIEQAQL
jgi:hypothetical protein